MQQTFSTARLDAVASIARMQCMAEQSCKQEHQAKPLVQAIVAYHL